MQYINPIEILNLSNLADSSQLDIDIIKKAKRRLFAEIDLSDGGYYNYYGLQLSKGDCENAIDELSKNDPKEFYLYLTSNQNLNEFLVNGNESVFDSYKQDSIFKLPDFINFISPYFAPKFDKALFNAFESENVERLRSILSASFLIAQADINTAYKSISNALQNRLAELSEIRNDIKNDESAYDDYDIQELLDLVVAYFPSDVLNNLPIYFQSQILKIANEINYLGVAIWDNFDNTQVCQDLLEHILTLNIDGLNKPTFEKNYEIVKRRNKERINEDKNAPVLREYASYLIQSRNKIEEIESKTLTPSALLFWVNTSISITDLNGLPNTFDEIRNQVAYSLRAMSVNVWNSYSNYEVAIDLINKASSISGLRAETQDNLRDAKQQLISLKTKIDLADSLRQRAGMTNPNSKNRKGLSSDRNTGLLWFILVVVIIVIYLSTTSSDKSLSSNNSYSNNTSYIPQMTDTTSDEVYTAPVESEYKGNQLKDGASPLDGCFGKGVYSGNAKLTIKNGGSSDAIICLYSTAYGRTIRNEYVRKNSSFTMSNIAQGSYKIRVFYGNDWNPSLINSCGTKGNFESDVQFSEFDGTEYFEDSHRGYTNATITLYAVPGGNASSSAIDQSTFFNNK
jgi:hypothetical protein